MTTTEHDLIFDELYENVANRFHEALDDELTLLIDELSLSPSMAIKLIDSFYQNEIKQPKQIRSNNAPKKEKAG